MFIYLFIINLFVWVTELEGCTSNKSICVSSEDSDQPAHLGRLIRVFMGSGVLWISCFKLFKVCSISV